MASEEGSTSLVDLDTERLSTLETIPLHSTNLLTLLDERGIIQYESPAIERIYGFDQEELVGQQVADYFHPEDRERVVDAYEHIVASEGRAVEAVEYRHEQVDGSYCWVESVASTNPTPEGYYVINTRDISERKARERQLEATRREAENERDGKEAIRQLLLQTASDDELADTVCRTLVQQYDYDTARVLHTGDGDAPAVVARHGEDSEFWQGDDAADVTRRALETGETVTATADDETSVGQRLAATGLQVVRAVRLEYDGVSYGVLVVARREQETVLARQLVEEFGDALAFKHRIGRQRESLTAGTVLELAVRFTGSALGRLSQTDALAGTTVLAQELGETDAGTQSFLVRTDALGGDDLATAARSLDGVTDVARVTTDEATRQVVRVTVTRPTLGSVVAGYGGTIEAMTARDGVVDATVQFPRRTDPGTVTDTLGTHWGDATVQSSAVRSIERQQAVAFGNLTDKQREALRAATFSGFFDRPQQANAGEVAESLGVSPSTFLHHVRNAEQAVFQRMFHGEQ